MKKITALALAGLVALSSIASATKSRVDAFGPSRVFINDVNSMWNVPTRLLQNADMGFIELGKGDSSNAFDSTDNNIETQPWGGANVSLFGGVVGIWLNRDAGEFDAVINKSRHRDHGFDDHGGDFYNGIYEDYAGIAGNANRTKEVLKAFKPGSRVDLLYGWSASDKLDLTVGVNRANNSFRSKDGNEEVYVSNVNEGLLLGAALKNPYAGIENLEVGLAMNQQSAKAGGVGIYTNNVDMGFTSKMVGYMLTFKTDLSADKKTISKVNLQMGGDEMISRDHGWYEDHGTNEPSEKVSRSTFNIGYAAGKSSDKAMGLVGVTFRNEDNTLNRHLDNLDSEEFSFSHIEFANEQSLRVVAAGEAKVKEWLVFRGGIGSKVWGVDSESRKLVDSDFGGNEISSLSKEYPVATELSTGFGFLLGDVTIDTTFNRDFLYTGPFFITSSGDSLINTQVSATIDFGGSKE